MYAWRVWYSYVILYVCLQRGKAERIRGNDLLDEYDDGLDGTDTWADRNSTRSGTEVPIRTPAVMDIYTASNSTPSENSIYTANASTPSGADFWTSDHSTRSRTGVWTEGNSGGSGTDVLAENNVTRPETDVPIDNNVTRPETDVPIDNNVTRLVTDITTHPRTVSKSTVSVDEVPTGTYTTPVTDTSDICKNSSCPDLLLLTTTVPEGANVTLQCKSASDASPLGWYRDATVLQRGVGEVLLYIPDSDGSQSGSYLCADQSGCCIVKHHLTVYGVPPYAYHLAVMGAILAVGLPLCVFLSVRQSSRLGRYARMFSERHGDAEQMLL